MAYEALPGAFFPSPPQGFGSCPPAIVTLVSFGFAREYGLRAHSGLNKGVQVDMPKNVGAADRVVRIVIGVGLAVMIYLQVLPPGVANIVAGIVAAYLVVTGLLGRCVLYKMVDVDTSIQEQPYSTTDDRAGF